MGPRLVHQRAHAAYGRRQTDENGLADQEVADVELHHLRDGRDGLDGVVVDAVTGVDLEPQRLRLIGRRAQRIEMGAGFPRPPLTGRIAERPGVPYTD